MQAFRAHVVFWLIPSSLAQYYCCIDGKCPYKDPTPPGFDCFQSESKCNSQSSCGDPTTPPLESPEPNTQKTNLCVYKCADDVAEYVCLDDGCPDTYGDCSRAFWYNVAADGCGELGSHTYDSGGEKVGDQTDAHVSINGNAMHQVALAY
ncbi:unnamed protein product [Effrenium voratum]|nr:unnamed protein product [Effrenium voratum]